jgi:YVTN family beta-propeller protein
MPRFFLFAKRSATYPVPVGPAGADEHSKAGASMRPFRWVLGFGDRIGGRAGGWRSGGRVGRGSTSAVPGDRLVTNTGSNTVSTIDVETRTKHPGDITVGGQPLKVAVTPDGKSQRPAVVVRAKGSCHPELAGQVAGRCCSPASEHFGGPADIGARWGRSGRRRRRSSRRDRSHRP